jgi:hypothetical protein
MRNDARPVGAEFRDVAEHSDQPGEKGREPAEGPRPETPSEKGRSSDSQPTDNRNRRGAERQSER